MTSNSESDRTMTRIRGVFGTSEHANRIWLAMLFGLLIFALAAFSSTYLSIVDIWLQSKTYVHGFVILPISIALIWRQRGALAAAPKSPFWPGLVGLFVLSLSWWVCNTLGIQVGKQFASVAILPMLVLTILGTTATARIAFPLAYLVFAVPFGDFLIPSLVEFTAQFTVAALNITGIPVFRDAQFFSTPSGNFEVARACSGVRFLLASMSVGVLYAYLSFRSNKARAAFIVFSAVFPILANGLRVYVIVLVAHFSNMRLAVGVDHIVYGWVFFAIVVGTMLLIGSRFQDHDGDASTATDSATQFTKVAGPAPAVAVLLVLLTSTLLAVGPATARLTNQSSAGHRSQAVAVPAGIAGWDGPAITASEWRPVFVNPTSQGAVSYSSGESVVELVVIQYAGASQSAELANSANMVVDEDAWTVKTPRIVKTGVSRGPVEAREIIGSRLGEDRLVWYWYDVNGRRLLSVSSVKIQETVNWLSGTPTLSTLIAVSAPVNEDYGSTSAILSQFLNVSSELIDACFKNPSSGASQCSAAEPPGTTD